MNQPCPNATRAPWPKGHVMHFGLIRNCVYQYAFRCGNLWDFAHPWFLPQREMPHIAVHWPRGHADGKPFRIGATVKCEVSRLRSMLRLFGNAQLPNELWDNFYFGSCKVQKSLLRNVWSLTNSRVDSSQFYNEALGNGFMCIWIVPTKVVCLLHTLFMLFICL